MILILGVSTYAQKSCDYSVAPTKENNYLKTTKDHLMYEKVFGGTSSFIFFSLTNSEGVPMLNFQLLAKSKEFPKIHCFDKDSKIYLQLANGKIITLLNALSDENCSGLVFDDAEKNNIRILATTFLFTKGSLEELEKSPVTMMRVKYSTDMVDYPVRKELSSETMKEKYQPETYFVNNLRCIQ